MSDEIKEISDIFWKQWDFWINLLLAIGGIVIGLFSLKFSIKSFKEAGKAKAEAIKATQAAQKAGKTVRKQDIIVMLTEVLNECNIKETAKYPESSGKHRLIHRRISNIRGLYSNDLNPEQTEHLEKIEGSLKIVRSTLDLFNTAVSGDLPEGSTEDFLFLSLEPYMTELSGHIELLKGALQDSLI